MSHSASLEDKQRIQVEDVDVPWFHGPFNTFFLKFSVSVGPFCSNFNVFLSLFAGKHVQNENVED